MSEWQEVRLGDVLDKIVGGGTPSKENPSYWDGGDIFWCSVKDMSDDKFRISQTKDTITLDGLQNSSSNLIPKGTVITATRMGLGRAFINETDMAINQDLKALIPNSTIDNKYLLWTIILYRNYIEMLGNGATVKGIRLETFKNIKINLPPLPTQQKIAKILSNYDDLIENNLKRIKLLEESARLTYEEWFLRFRIDGKKLDIDPETKLPFGWVKVKLKNFCILTMGQSPKSKFYNQTCEGLPFHQGVTNYGFRFPSNTTWSTEGSRIAEEGDILFSVRAPVGRLNVSIEKIILGRGLASIRQINDLNSFLFYQLQNIFFEDNLMGSGAIFDSVTKRDVEDIELIYSKNISEKFNTLTSTIDNEIKNLTNQNKFLKEARDILLPRLMTGMIDTDNMDIAV